MPSTPDPPADAFRLAEELTALGAQAEGLAAEIAGEMAAATSGDGADEPWGTPAWRELAERVLPLSLKDECAEPGARQLAGLMRRRLRLLREGAVLRAQSDAALAEMRDLRALALALRACSRPLRDGSFRDPADGTRSGHRDPQEWRSWADGVGAVRERSRRLAEWSAAVADYQARRRRERFPG